MVLAVTAAGKARAAGARGERMPLKKAHVRESVSDLSTTGSDLSNTGSDDEDHAGEATLSRPCRRPLRTRERDLSRMKHDELAKMLHEEQAEGVPASFFLLAAACCHTMLLIGLLISSQAPFLALISPTVVAGVTTFSRLALNTPAEPYSTLFLLFGIQAMMITTWYVHSQFSA